MANEKNLKKFGKDKPPLSREEAVRKGKEGGKASAKARAEAKTAREILEVLDTLAVTGTNRAKLDGLGIPPELCTQQTLRLVALHGKAMQGDVPAIKLILDIKGESPAEKVNVEVTNPLKGLSEEELRALANNGRTETTDSG